HGVHARIHQGVNLRGRSPRCQAGGLSGLRPVFLGLTRTLGILGRYVSGYSHPARDPALGEGVKGQSDAWAEVWVGDWVAFDPTNGKPPGLRHVQVGRGRDYRDVSPLRGIYSGAAAHALDVEVTLTRVG
ncbi:MAG: transglutaminase family protein, partial [Actinomycetota bacterium]|nr:transglutaminase family protein [Actinomycetota bacterium]